MEMFEGHELGWEKGHGWSLVAAAFTSPLPGSSSPGLDLGRESGNVEDEKHYLPLLAGLSL